MPTLRLFSSAREAAGVDSDMVAGDTVEEVLDEASMRYGAAFIQVLAVSGVLINGEIADRSRQTEYNDEIVILPLGT